MEMDTADYTKLVTSHVSSGYTALVMGFSHKCGLLDVLCSAGKPMTIIEISEKAELKKRYVIEMLGTLASAGVVQFNRVTNTFYVPEVHRPALVYSCVTATGCITAGKTSDSLLQCVSKDGPSGYEMRDFQDIFLFFDALRAQEAPMFLEGDMLPLLKDIGIIEKLENGITVTELGCGCGNFLLFLAKRFPKSTFVGVDYDKSAIQKMKEHIQKEMLTNTTVEFGDILATNVQPEKHNQSDWLFMYDILHDLSNPQLALENIYKFAKQGGVFSLVDFGFQSSMAENVDHPAAPTYYAMSTYFCLPSSMVREPHVGHGSLWGINNMTECVRKSSFELKSVTMSKMEPKRAIYTLQKN